MQAEAFERGDPVPDSQGIWNEHCLSAVKRFLKSAVVIDNEPFVKTGPPSPALDFSLEVPDDGMSHLDPTLTSIQLNTDNSALHTELENPHQLDVRKISDAFAENGLACAFVLPEDDAFNEEAVVKRVLNSAIACDIVVIDWFLYDGSPNLTKRILREIAVSDVSENGRLRFICVYTGQPLTDGVSQDVRESLAEGGVTVDEIADGVLYSEKQSCLAIVLNKQSVSSADLPTILVNQFCKFADGLLPSFALAAVGAIRKNSHHMVTRFGSHLDSAYVANRLISDPPEDVAEMMRELLVAECDNALGLESVADRYLDKYALTHWLAHNKDKFVEPSYKKGKNIDSLLISQLLNNGIDNKGTKTDAGEPVSFGIEHRHRVSEALAGGPAASKQAESDFSRLVVFKREGFGDSKLFGGEGWLPSLTTGTLLQCQSGEVKRYFLCLTPACDTLRLARETPFVFLEATIDDECYSLVFKDADGGYRGLYFREKHPTLATFSFLPDERGRVRGAIHCPEVGTPYFTFSNVGGTHVFTWIGEIRYARAASEMAKLAGNWMRIGIKDSEFLRLTEAGKFKSI
ncbi:response regulator receiver domain [Stutzerimonas stutzeri]|uniref:response regulator receiver domain n=1 Tax=Stutzerimonas stutzeri TaxID=316 RepID=UPI00244BB3E8|nr:response regulator receiver domain [Stutzerimonas stutzeri]MDH0185117.1 response regulator receiver domain [Stutzerimonas stutzeri]MDH1250976.1 response regulator receiver domain [Stutzerimonas stutzeri]MDH1672818.1 response regulator receiver domain [Stutzerimonas stutzeri]